MYSTSQRDRFTKKNRLPDSAVYKRVFTFGLQGAVGALKWFALSNGTQTARLGTAIPKRYVKTAVQRNHIKRIVRESFRFNQEMLAGFDVIIVLRKAIQDDQCVREHLSNIWPQVVEYSSKHGSETKAD